MRLSVVTTMYRSAVYLPEFHRRATTAARRFADDDYELVFVNDGSPDDSLEIALELQAADPHVRIVDLSRNFGHHQAMWTGLQHARGEWVYLLDCDLEESPEWLVDLLAKQSATDADVVYGVQNARSGGAFRRISGWVFYKLFNALSTVPIPRNLMTLRLMSRRYVEALLRHTEATFVIATLWAHTGFLQVSLPFNKGCKKSTTYSPLRCVKLFVNSLTAASEAPLLFSFYSGTVLLAISVIATVCLIIRHLYFGKLLDGWVSLIVSIWFLGGLILFCLGVVGIYLARVLQESKRRPIAIVRNIYEVEATDVMPLRARYESRA